MAHMGAALSSTPPPKRRARTRAESKAKTARANGKSTAHPGRRWLWIIPTLAVGLVATLAVFTFSPADDGAWSTGRATQNVIGPVGLAPPVGELEPAHEPPEGPP